MYKLSQEIRQHVLEMHTFGRLRHSLKNLELVLPRLLDLHYRCQIVAAVAVVRRTPHGHQILILPQITHTLNQWM